MSYSHMLYSKVREYLITSTDTRLHGDGSSEGAAATFWMFTLPKAPSNNYDEVYPDIFMGDNSIATDKAYLKRIGITHVINCHQGSGQRETNTSSRFYRDAGIKYLGLKALDMPTYNMMPHFKPAADFIDKAIKGGGKVYVHCLKGVSRSATIVIVYLMLKLDIHLWEAVKIIRAKRKIHPNDGFIRQLCMFNHELHGSSYESG